MYRWDAGRDQHSASKSLCRGASRKYSETTACNRHKTVSYECQNPCHQGNTKQINLIRRAQAAPRIAHKPYVLETNRTGSADNSPERPPKRQTLGASLSTKQRCLSENLIQQPNKPHKLCRLFRSVFDNPSDAAQRGNERGNEQ